MATQSTVTPRDRLRRRLSTISNLPSPPVVYTQISRVINDPDTSVKDVAAIMSEDAAMSAKVLRLSNTAFYGARNEITNIRQAVLLLGLEAVKSLVLSSSVFEMFKNHSNDADFQAGFWRHSLATALAGRVIVRNHPSLTGLDPEVAFSAGLLHDIGKLIVCCFMPEEHKGIMSQMSGGKMSMYQAEENTIGFSHTLVGQMLAENWKLPHAIQCGIEHHHFPRFDREEPEFYSVIVHIANYVAHKTLDGKLPQIEGWSYLLPEVTEALSLTDELTEQFCKLLFEAYSNSSTFLQMAMAG